MSLPRTCLSCLLIMCLLASGAVGQPKSSSPITEGFAPTSTGIRIHYLLAGQSTSAPALVFIPGWRLPAYLWNEQLTHFSQTHRVLAIDPRSQGESTKTSDDNTPESRAKDLREVLANLGISRFVLIGWSQGAQDVAAYLQQFGTDSVTGVVFVDSPVSAGPAELEVHKEFAKVVLSGISIYARYPEEYSEGMVHSLFSKPHPELDLQKITKSTLQTPTNTGIAMLVADIFGSDRRPALTKLDRPTLVIASSNSPLLDAQRQMAANIAGAKFQVIEGTGHAVFVDEPAKFNEGLQTFLESLAR